MSATAANLHASSRTAIDSAKVIATAVANRALVNAEGPAHVAFARTDVQHAIDFALAEADYHLDISGTLAGRWSANVSTRPVDTYRHARSVAVSDWQQRLRIGFRDLARDTTSADAKYRHQVALATAARNDAQTAADEDFVRGQASAQAALDVAGVAADQVYASGLTARDNGRRNALAAAARTHAVAHAQAARSHAVAQASDAAVRQLALATEARDYQSASGPAEVFYREQLLAAAQNYLSSIAPNAFEVNQAAVNAAYSTYEVAIQSLSASRQSDEAAANADRRRADAESLLTRATFEALADKNWRVAVAGADETWSVNEAAGARDLVVALAAAEFSYATAHSNLPATYSSASTAADNTYWNQEQTADNAWTRAVSEARGEFRADQYSAQAAAIGSNLAPAGAGPWYAFRAGLAAAQRDWWQNQLPTYLDWTLDVNAAKSTQRTTLASAYTARNTAQATAERVHATAQAATTRSRDVAVAAATRTYIVDMAAASRVYVTAAAEAERVQRVDSATAERHLTVGQDTTGNEVDYFDYLDLLSAATDRRNDATELARRDYATSEASASGRLRIGVADADRTLANAAGAATVAWVQASQSADETYSYSRSQAETTHVAVVTSRDAVYDASEASSYDAAISTFAGNNSSPWSSQASARSNADVTYAGRFATATTALKAAVASAERRSEEDTATARRTHRNAHVSAERSRFDGHAAAVSGASRFRSLTIGRAARTGEYRPELPKVASVPSLAERAVDAVLEGDYPILPWSLPLAVDPITAMYPWITVRERGWITPPIPATGDHLRPGLVWTPNGPLPVPPESVDTRNNLSVPRLVSEFSDYHRAFLSLLAESSGLARAPLSSAEPVGDGLAFPFAAPVEALHFTFPHLWETATDADPIDGISPALLPGGTNSGPGSRLNGSPAPGPAAPPTPAAPPSTSGSPSSCSDSGPRSPLQTWELAGTPIRAPLTTRSTEFRPRDELVIPKLEVLTKEQADRLAQEELQRLGADLERWKADLEAAPARRQIEFLYDLAGIPADERHMSWPEFQWYVVIPAQAKLGAIRLREQKIHEEMKVAPPKLSSDHLWARDGSVRNINPRDLDPVVRASILNPGPETPGCVGSVLVYDHQTHQSGAQALDYSEHDLAAIERAFLAAERRIWEREFPIDAFLERTATAAPIVGAVGLTVLVVVQPEVGIPIAVALDLGTLLNPEASGVQRSLAGASLALSVVPAGKLLRLAQQTKSFDAGLDVSTLGAKAVTLRSTVATPSGIRAPMAWESHPVHGAIVNLTPDDALIRGMQIPLPRALSPLELDEISHAFGNIEVAMVRNISSGSHNLVFGVSSTRIDFRAMRGQELLFHVHPGGSLVPSRADVTTLVAFYGLNSADGVFVDTSRIVARIGGVDGNLGSGVRVFTFDRHGTTSNHRVLLRVLYGQ